MPRLFQQASYVNELQQTSAAEGRRRRFLDGSRLFNKIFVGTGKGPALEK